ncbi:MAG: molybdopterin-dependent oxidoreductase [Eubacteriales bacterium]|nr:molybdopterin-dependent oxidoreductase [Eubacteriales bacterium]
MQDEKKDLIKHKPPRFDGEVQLNAGLKLTPQRNERAHRHVGHSVAKIDSEALTLGRPVYTADLIDPDALTIKILRSSKANAYIESIDTEAALKLEGVVGIYTYEDVPQTRFTLAGQTFPEASHYDQLILDRHVRYVGDEVAIIAAESREAAEVAMRLIKVRYQNLPAVLDFESALDNEVLVHNPEDVICNLPLEVGGQDLARNLIGVHDHYFGDQDFNSVYEAADVQFDEVYYTTAQAQSMMETFRSHTRLDPRGRLEVITSTQVPFHIKRQLVRALGLRPSQVHVIKPRVGGGFGAKQSSVSEIFPAFVTLKTGRPAYLEYTREECYIASNSRHAMRIRVRIAAKQDGEIEAIDIDALSDQGAYNLHGWTTLGLVGEKTLPLFAHLKSAHFHGKVVYTNKMPAGAFRGYGATQGAFAVEAAINELAQRLKLDPIELRLQNTYRQGDQTLAYNKLLLSNGLERCIRKAKEKMGIDDIHEIEWIDDEHVCSYGMAITMQGSGIEYIDVSTVHVRLNEEGDYSLFISATDVGTGTDTALTQMASEILQTDMENIIVISADTDLTPYDPGSYASSGVYVTGNAVVRACDDLKTKIIEKAAQIHGLNPKNLALIDDQIVSLDGDFELAVRDLSEQLTCGPDGCSLAGHASFGGNTSPPPFMAGFVNIETDLRTGRVSPLRYVAVVDCGKIINPALARVQAEGGIVQGIGFALSEDIHYGRDGRIQNSDFLDYRLPNRMDIGEIDVDFIETYEPSGPFGAKSIGEIVVNTPTGAIADAIYNGTGAIVRDLPFSPEKVYFAIQAAKSKEPKV